jgi:hypothetical protein
MVSGESEITAMENLKRPLYHMAKRDYSATDAN